MPSCSMQGFHFLAFQHIKLTPKKVSSKWQRHIQRAWRERAQKRKRQLRGKEKARYPPGKDCKDGRHDEGSCWKSKFHLPGGKRQSMLEVFWLSQTPWLVCFPPPNNNKQKLGEINLKKKIKHKTKSLPVGTTNERLMGRSQVLFKKCPL